MRTKHSDCRMPPGRESSRASASRLNLLPGQQEDEDCARRPQNLSDYAYSLTPNRKYEGRSVLCREALVLYGVQNAFGRGRVCMPRSMWNVPETRNTLALI
jgi:hypothetical protein